MAFYLSEEDAEKHGFKIKAVEKLDKNGNVRTKSMIVAETNEYGHHGTHSVGYEQALIDKVSGLIAQRGQITFNNASFVSRFMFDQGKASKSPSDFQFPLMLNNNMVSCKNGTSVSSGELFDNLFLPLWNGLNKKDWTDFSREIQKYELESALTALLMGLSVISAGALNESLVPNAINAIQKVGVWQTAIEIFELNLKIAGKNAVWNP